MGADEYCRWVDAGLKDCFSINLIIAGACPFDNSSFSGLRNMCPYQVQNFCHNLKKAWVKAGKNSEIGGRAIGC